MLLADIYSLSWYLDIIQRTAGVYVFLVIGIMIIGRKEISQLSIADLVFVLLISNAVQNAMLGPDTSLAGGVLAAGVLFICNYLFRLITYRFGFIRKFFGPDPVMLIYEGKVLKDNLARLKITEEELLTAVHEHGLASPDKADLAILEPDGNISVISYDVTRHTRVPHKKKKMPVRIG